MYKQILTSNDIKTLVKEAHKLPLGAVKTGSIQNFVIETENKPTKVIARFSSDNSSKETKSINITGKVQENATEYQLTGTVFTESFKNFTHYLLSKKSLAELVNDIYAKIKLRFLNQSSLFELYYDHLGRVFVIGKENNIYYLNKDQTGFLNINGEYFDLKKDEEGYFLDLNPALNSENFQYFYITNKKAQENAVEPNIKTNSNVIDLKPYLEEQPHR